MKFKTPGCSRPSLVGWLLLVLLCGSGGRLLAQESKTLSTQVYFATARHELTKEAKSALQDLSQQLLSYANYSLTIEAHTDERGSDSYNDALARRRAEAVQTFLNRIGVQAASLKVSSYGERQARPTDSEQLLSQDRRVDVQVQVSAWTDAASVVRELQIGQTQTIDIDPTKTQMITGDKGGRFLLDANSLVDANGQAVTEPVRLQLVEAYSMEDMLLQQLTTTSGEQLLETGGMLRLTAETTSGEPLQLRPGRAVYAAIPTQNFDPDMRIFYGEGQNTHGAPTDWAPTPGRVRTSALDLLPIPPPPPNVGVNIESVLGSRLARWKEDNPRPEPPFTEQLLPRHPGPEPRPDTRRYYLKGIKKWFVSRDQRARKEQQLYEKAMERYQQRLARYESTLAAAEKHNGKVALNDENYQRELVAWNEAFLRTQKMYRDELMAKYGEQIRRDSIAYAQWREKRLAMMEEALLTTDNLQQDDVQRYFFAVNTLGWVNCDIFRYTEAQQTQLVAIDVDQDAPSVMVVLKSPRSVLSLSSEGDGRMVLDRVPVNLEGDLIAYKVKDGQLFLAEHPLRTEAGKQLTLEYRPIPLQELRAALARYKDS